jgi:ketosteroid isomerase-like protein
MPDQSDIVRAIFDAYVHKDRAAAEQLIADDFRFTGPLDNNIDRETYFSRCWPTSDTIADFKLLYVAEAGNRVFVTYEGRRQAGDGFRNTEMLLVEGGKVRAVEVYFGWRLPHPAAPGGFVNA